MTRKVKADSTPVKLLKAVALELWLLGYRGDEFIAQFNSRFAFNWREYWDVPDSAVIEYVMANAEQYAALKRADVAVH
jgi:hypothetical protein